MFLINYIKKLFIKIKKNKIVNKNKLMIKVVKNKVFLVKVSIKVCIIKQNKTLIKKGIYK